jgi:hypothetical protein
MLRRARAVLRYPQAQVAEWVGERLMQPYRYKYNPTENDMPMPRNFQPEALPERCASSWAQRQRVRLLACQQTDR